MTGQSIGSPIELRDPATGLVTATLTGATSSTVTALAARGWLLLSGERDGTVRLWDLFERRELAGS